MIRLARIITFPVEVVHIVLDYAVSHILAYNVTRFLVVCMFFPLYVLTVISPMIPYMIVNFMSLFSESGWNMLIRTTEFHRDRQSEQAQAQFDGKYEFPENMLFRVKRGGYEWMDDMPWTDNTAEFKVCGATVRYVHLKPAIDGDSGEVKKSILFLHGNPTWSQIWRRVCLVFLTCKFSSAN